MPTPPAILDNQGRVISSTDIARIREGARGGRGRMRGSLSGQSPQWFPYDGADWSSKETGGWYPWIRSPDSEINIYRDRMAARVRDLRRNDPWVSGAISRILDSTIGASYRFVAKPDYRVLSLHAKGFDAVWAAEYRQALEALLRDWADDVGHYADLTQEMSLSQIFRVALGHKLVDGESVLMAHWRPDRIGPGAAKWATCLQGIDPDLLSNPFQGPDTRYLRGGVELDDDQVHVAYHFRKAHQYDWYNSVQSMQWERVERIDPDGWRRVYHDYDPERFGQSRGVSVFAPVISKLKMLARLYGVKLQAENVAAAFGLYIESPFDVEMIRNALDDEDQDEKGLGWYQDMRADFHSERDLQVNGVKLATLAPGEKIQSVAPGGGQQDITPFAHEMLRAVSVCLGTSAEEVHNDYGDSSWSSARAGIVQSEKTYTRRCEDFSQNTATPVVATWLEEPFERGLLPLPRNAPSYIEQRTAYSRGRWLGAARGWVDPVAERQGVVLGLDAGLSTMEDECARQGADWEENLEQRAIEYKRMKELGLPAPRWFGQDYSATQAAQAPSTEQP